MDLIIYHNNCPDGFCAALIGKKRYPEAQLHPMNHGQENALANLLPLVTGKDILMVDFSLRTRAENIAVFEAAKSFRIFDHHKTAEAELEGLDFAAFDMKRSGAGLTWDELFGKYDDQVYKSDKDIRIGPNRSYTGMPEPNRPWYVDFVEDRDLWTWALPRTKEINAFIMTLPFTETAWRALETMTADQAANLGTGALAHVDHYVREIVNHRQMGAIESDILGISVSGKHERIKLKYSVAVVNAPYLNCSEVGNVLATDYAHIGLSWFERGDGVIQFSLRSNDDIDVSAIAKKYNGGGHRNAAGFQLSREEGHKLIDSILGR